MIPLTKKELKSMGDKLKSKRIQLGYTQEKVAELTNISYSTFLIVLILKLKMQYKALL